MITIVELFGSWEGRIGRLTYLAAWLALIVVSAIGGAMLSGNVVAVGVFALITIYPNWIISVKRAHDLGKSGWWIFGWVAAALVALVLVGLTKAMPDAAILLVLIALPLSLVAFWNIVVKMFFFAGTPGVNRFGPPSRMAETLFNDNNADAGPVDAPMAKMRVPVAAPKSAVRSGPLATAPRGLRAANTVRPAGFGRRGVA